MATNKDTEEFQQPGVQDVEHKPLSTKTVMDVYPKYEEGKVASQVE